MQKSTIKDKTIQSPSPTNLKTLNKNSKKVPLSKNSTILGCEKIGKLLFNQSAPAMIGMLVMSLYNIVDTIFVGRGVGTLGIAGIAIAYPIQMFVLAISLSIGIGMASIISRSLGAKNINLAEEVLGNFFFIIIIAGISITTAGIIFLVPLLRLFGATTTILPYSIDYMEIILAGTIFFAFLSASNNIIRAEGSAKYAMTVMLIGTIVNIILDPIFIFQLKMGIKGAAFATVIAQMLAALFALFYFVSGRSVIKFYWKFFRTNWTIFKESFAIGSSSFARQVGNCLMILILNNALGANGGDLAIAAYGVINRVLMFTYMPIFGLVQGLQPIVGLNYGAKQYERTKESIILAIKVVTLIASATLIVLMFFSKVIMSIFSTDQELIIMAANATKIIILMFPLVGFQIITGGTYQAIGKATPAFIVSLLKPIICFIPMLLILPLFFQLQGVWFSFPSADGLAAILTFFMLYKEIQMLNRKINQNSLDSHAYTA